MYEALNIDKNYILVKHGALNIDESFKSSYSLIRQYLSNKKSRDNIIFFLEKGIGV